jgi:hypothetical protein
VAGGGGENTIRWMEWKLPGTEQTNSMDWQIDKAAFLKASHFGAGNRKNKNPLALVDQSPCGG